MQKNNVGRLQFKQNRSGCFDVNSLRQWKQKLVTRLLKNQATMDITTVDRRKSGQMWWIYSEYILNTESTRFADVLYVGLKDNLWSVNISNKSLIVS